MRKPRRGSRTGLWLLALVLAGTSAARTVFAEEAASGAHGDSKGSAAHGNGKGSVAPGEVSGPSSGGHGYGARDGSGKGDARPSQGDDNKGRQGGAPDRGEPAKDAGPSSPLPAKDSSNTEPTVEPARRLDKGKSRAGQDNAAVQPRKPSLGRRLSPLPQAPAPNPVRNAIGIAVPAHENADRHDSAHASPAVPHPPGLTPVVPGNVTGRLSKTEGTNHPFASPVVTAPAANRGAINGTGVTRHSIGPPRIGGPTASVSGINGTTIRTKH